MKERVTVSQREASPRARLDGMHVQVEQLPEAPTMPLEPCARCQP